MSKFEIKQQAIAGTAESSDIQITLDKGSGSGIEIELQSNVIKQYGRQIRNVITETLTSMGIDNAKVVAVDKGALDCTIKARTITAVHRANGITAEFNWEEMDSWNA